MSVPGNGHFFLMSSIVNVATFPMMIHHFCHLRLILTFIKAFYYFIVKKK